MNKEELHVIVVNEQPNICQIVAIKVNEIVYFQNDFYALRQQNSDLPYIWS